MEGMGMKMICFGTGLASSKEESRGFGLELLGMVLKSLILTKEHGADGVLHEIGTVGYNVSEKQHSRLIEQQQNLILNMIQNLGIENVYNVVLSHSYHASDLFKSIFQEVELKMFPFANLQNFQLYGEYTIIQIAQMRYLYCTKNTMIKLGWIVGNGPALDVIDTEKAEMLINQGKLNEYYFDSMYRYCFPDDDFSFIYTTAGIDIIDGKKYAPYTVTRSQRRPLLTDPIKPYLLKIPESKHKREALKNYENNIVLNWENLFGEIDTYNHISADEKLVTKLQFIQDRVLGACAA